MDPTDANTIYYEHQFGRLRRKDIEEGTIVDIMPEAAIGEPPLKYNWSSPFLISHFNPFTLYFGANRLFKSVNRGDSWQAISPDLTTKPGPERQGDVPYGTITSVSESHLKQGLIYVGTDDGNVHVMKNEGTEWTAIRKGLPAKWVSRVVASQHEPGTVYVSLTGYREDDFKTYLYVSDDYGAGWRPIASNLPDEAVNVVQEDPRNGNVLYVGTDLGVYVSLNRGERWHSLMNGLPTTPVHDIRIHPRNRELVIGTHGRSVFVADMAPIQALTDEILSKKAHLFEIPPARLGRKWEGRGEWEQQANKDAVIYYFLSETDEVTVSIREEGGELVRTLEGTSNVGLNRVVWDLSSESTEEAVPPGHYGIELQVGDMKLEGQVQVRSNQPRT